jgi:hypothetical protein
VLFGFRTRRVIDIDEDAAMTFKPITDEGDLYKINEISGMLEVDETILLVIRQSRISLVGFRFSPNVIYATDRRVILRDNSILGLKEDIVGIPYTTITDVFQENTFISSSVRLSLRRIQNDNRLNAPSQFETTESENELLIEHIPRSKADNLIRLIKSRISKRNLELNVQDRHVDSPADELVKIAKLKNDGIINEQEFIRLKQIIIERIH